MRVLVVCAGVLAAVSTATMTGHPSEAERPVGGRIDTTVSDNIRMANYLGYVNQVGDLPDVDGAVADVVTAFYADVQRQIDEYLQWQHEQDVALWIATHQPPPQQRSVTTGSSAPANVSGDCAPVAAIIGWGIVNRESGGNPGARNSSSGAFGCSQTLPSHYNPGGACAGMDMYSVAGQTACTQSLYDRGGLTPWNLTR